MNNKEKAIELAYGKMFKSLSELQQKEVLENDGWIYGLPIGVFKDYKIDYDIKNGIDFNYFRPKSLQGIETYFTFKQVLGFDFYYLNELGILKSIDRTTTQKNNKPYTTKGKTLVPQTDSHGYIVFALRKDGKTIKVYLHRILAELFIPNPENKPCVNHKDGVKYNNNLSNLEWSTYQENNQHAFEIGLQKKGKEHHFFNKTGVDCHNSKKIIDNNSGKIFDSVKEASIHFKISRPHLSNILKGIKKSDLNVSFYNPPIH